MAAKKLTNCCVAALASQLRRTSAHLIAQQSRALHLALLAYPSKLILFAKVSKLIILTTPLGKDTILSLGFHRHP